MENLAHILNTGGVAVIPTDTLYGLVGSALDKKIVEKIYTIKKRTPTKPPIILVSSIEDIRQFGVVFDTKTEVMLNQYWPGKVSIILPIHKVEPCEKFEYLHRGGNTLAFRVPNKKDLLELLKQTGPLIAPSANPEGEKPAETIEEAQKYFGKNVDMYIDGGKISSEPSTLIEIKDGNIRILREGAVKIQQKT